MFIRCLLCGETIEVPGSAVPGQHIRCPICGGKFSYQSQSREISSDDLRMAISVGCGDPAQEMYYRNAPEGAKLYIALLFYGRVFAKTLDRNVYAKAFRDVGMELRERDLRYLLRSEEDSDMRAYLSERLAAICGREEIAPRCEVETVPDVPDEVQAEKREQPRKRGAEAIVALSITALALAVVVFVVWNRQPDEKAPVSPIPPAPVSVAQSVAVPTVASQPGKDPVVRSETVEAEKNRQDLLAFQIYLHREEESLRRIVAESDREYDMIVADQRKLSAILDEIDVANARREERARTNGWIRYEKPETVMMFLKHKDANALAFQYLGEDLSALGNECRAKIKTAISMQLEEEALLAANRTKYNHTVQGADEEARKKLAKAESLRIEFNNNISNGISERKLQLHNKEEVLARLKSAPVQTKSILEEASVVQGEIVRLKKEIDEFQKFGESGKASAAHVAATYAESAARQRTDHALSERQDADNAVHVRMGQLRSLFALAVEYEGRSLDRIRAAMQSRKDLLKVRRTDAQRKLDEITGISQNADILSPEKISEIRRKIGEKIGDRILKGIE